MLRTHSRRRTTLVAAAATTALLLLAACGRGSATTSADNASLKGSSSEKYYLVSFYSGYPYWKDVYRGFEDAAKQLGVTPAYGGSTEYDVNSAVSSFNQVVAMHPDGIAVSAMDADAYKDPIDKAVDSGIPTVTFDSDSPKSKRITFLGTGNYQAGVQLARAVGAVYPRSQKVQVGVVTLTGQTNINERVKGFTDTIATEFPNVTIAQTVDAGKDEASAASATSNLLKANPGVGLVFGSTVTAEVGALTAIDESGRTGKVKVVTFDADDVTLKNIKAGKVELTMSQGPYNEGYWSMMMLYAVKHGTVNPVDGWAKYGVSPLPASVDTGAFLINSANVDAYLGSGAAASPSATSTH